MSWLVPLVLVALSVAAAVDCWHLPAPLVPGPPVAVWTALFIALPGLAALVWFAVPRLAAEEPAEAVAAPAGPLGPDDDPAFLRSIEPRRGESA